MSYRDLNDLNELNELCYYDNLEELHIEIDLNKFTTFNVNFINELIKEYSSESDLINLSEMNEIEIDSYELLDIHRTIPFIKFQYNHHTTPKKLIMKIPKILLTDEYKKFINCQNMDVETKDLLKFILNKIYKNNNNKKIGMANFIGALIRLLVILTINNNIRDKLSTFYKIDDNFHYRILKKIFPNVPETYLENKDSLPEDIDKIQNIFNYLNDECIFKNYNMDFIKFTPNICSNNIENFTNNSNWLSNPLVLFLIVGVLVFIFYKFSNKSNLINLSKLN